MGDSINMAARLMCNKLATQSVICDERTYSLSENEFIFDNLGQIKVKGKTKPISIFKPKCAKVNAPKDTFVGRQQERTFVQNYLHDQKSAPSPHFIVIESEGGLGLSTFSRWLKKEVSRSEFFVV